MLYFVYHAVASLDGDLPGMQEGLHSHANQEWWWNAGPVRMASETGNSRRRIRGGMSPLRQDLYLPSFRFEVSCGLTPVGDVGLIMKRSKATKRFRTARPRPHFTVTEQLANLRNYYEETSLRYQNSTSREERKHLLIVLKEIAKHARRLASDIQKYLIKPRRANLLPPKSGRSSS